MNKSFIRSLFMALCAIAALSASAAEGDRLYIEDFNIAPGETKWVYLMMDNPAYIMRGWQVDIELNEKIKIENALISGLSRYSTYLEDEDDPDSKTLSHQLDKNLKTDENTCRIIVYSMKQLDMLGHEGAVARLKVTAAEDFEGTTGLVVKDIVFTDAADPNTSIRFGNTTYTNVIRATTPLAKVLTEGVNGNEYVINEPLAVVAKAAKNNLIFASDGKDNWVKLTADAETYATVSQMTTIAGQTLLGTFSDKDTNPTLTITAAPKTATAEVTVTPKVYYLGDPVNKFAPKANEVITLTGYYFDDEPGGVMRGYRGLNGGHRGQSASLCLDWYEGTTELVPNSYYQLDNAVAQLKAAWDAEETTNAPSKVKASDDLSFQNYLVYPLEVPNAELFTGVDAIDAGNVQVSVEGRTITVTGAGNVAVFNAAGAKLSAKAVTTVGAAGVYVVVADGQATKVLVK
ncbi:MAG: hypothetical protein IJ808_07590 [Muribaculaceae bacterium]|nr:hypothetical protein [Muribaculaceae bacterium]